MSSTAPGRIVVTGAAGRLGSALVAALDGDDILGIDLAPPPADFAHPFLQTELADVAAVTAALRPDDLVVHVASVHLLSSSQIGRTDGVEDTLFDLNVKGTWQLYTAAAAAGVKRVVLTSSQAVTGTEMPTDLRIVTEDDRFGCYHPYSLSKRFQEEIAGAFVISAGIGTIALRPPFFVAVDALTYGLSLLGLNHSPALLLEEVVSAHVAAIRAVQAGRVLDPGAPTVEPVILLSRLPYQTSDAALLEGPDGYRNLVEKYWPGRWPWLTEHGFTPTTPPVLFDTSRAEKLLGWRGPTFDGWYAGNSDIPAPPPAA